MKHRFSYGVNRQYELTKKNIAKECAEWIRQKVCFKSNKTDEQMMGFINIDNVNYAPINGFTTVS